MAKAVRKITLSQSQDIPFNRLVLSQSNVRRIKTGVSVEELAQDIARRTLLQSLTVRPVLDDDGAETGMFEVPAGGRRYRALELLVKQKRLARTAPIPCVIRTGGLAEEDSLAENVQRAPLHPLDQFRAFHDLIEKGRTEEDVAAAFFVTVQVVKQRLRLATVSPTLLDVYAEDGMTLDQLMAFAVNPDHERQSEVWNALQRSHNKEPYYIRRLLTEGAVRACDKRAQFVGLEAYEAAGGEVMRDLFQQDEGGWLQDAVLLDRLVAEKLAREADNVRPEGWKWVEAATDFPYGHTYGLRRLSGEAVAMSDAKTSAAQVLRAEYERLEQENADVDVLPDEIDQRLGEIETALAELDERPLQYDPSEIAQAGVFISIDGSGTLRMERGYVRPDDEPAIPNSSTDENVEFSSATTTTPASRDVTADQTGSEQTEDELKQDEGIKPISDRLMTELTAYRTLALRDALARHPDVAHLAALHALCLELFYRSTAESCLDIEAKCVAFGSHAPSLGDTDLANAVDERHRLWSDRLPRESAKLWDMLAAFDQDSRGALFAHCIALSVNAVYEPWNRRPRALAHADCLAEAIGLDVAAAGWSPTIDAYLGRVTKDRILQAVRETRGEPATQLIEHLKKAEMAERAQEMLAGSGWLPEPLRASARTSGVIPPIFERGRTMQTGATEEDVPSIANRTTEPVPDYPNCHGITAAQEPLVVAE